MKRNYKSPIVKICIFYIFHNFNENMNKKKIKQHSQNFIAFQETNENIYNLIFLKKFLHLICYILSLNVFYSISPFKILMVSTRHPLYFSLLQISFSVTVIFLPSFSSIEMQNVPFYQAYFPPPLPFFKKKIRKDTSNFLFHQTA